MATFVLVHGGGHGGWCWTRLRPFLVAAGHDVHAPSLTGMGDRASAMRPGIDLDTHIADVVALLEHEDLTDVILVGHSYGGMVITGVADRATDRIGHLVYLDAATPQDGQALTDVSPGLMEYARSDAREVDGVELVLWPSEGFARVLGVTDDETVAWMMDRLSPQPWETFAQPLRLTNEAAMRALPRTDVVCVNELSGGQPPNDERSDGADRVWTIETGHDLMLTAPQETAELLLQVVDL